MIEKIAENLHPGFALPLPARADLSGRHQQGAHVLDRLLLDPPVRPCRTVGQRYEVPHRCRQATEHCAHSAKIGCAFLPDPARFSGCGEERFTGNVPIFSVLALASSDPIHMDAHASIIPTTVLVFLAAAVFAPPLFKRFGLGSIVGYLVAGLAFGPSFFGSTRIRSASSTSPNSASSSSSSSSDSNSNRPACSPCGATSSGSASASSPPRPR